MHKNKIKVEALNDHNYDGISRRIGSQYEINAKDLRLMTTVLGRVKVVVEKPKPPQPPMATKPPVPEVKETKPEATPTVRTPEGQYQRRDLRAKE